MKLRTYTESRKEVMEIHREVGPKSHEVLADRRGKRINLFPCDPC